MANNKSVYKYLFCPCGYKKIDATGKAKMPCPKCHTPMTHGENWHVRLMHKGVVKVKSVSPRRRDAEDYLANCKVQMKAGTYLSEAEEAAKKRLEEDTAEQDITWVDAVKNCTKWWESAVLMKEIKQSTADFYKWQVVALSEYFRDKSLLTIRKSDLIDYKIERTEAGIKPATINHEVKALKRMYSLHVNRTSPEESPRLCGRAMDIGRVDLMKKNSEKARYLDKKEIELLLEMAITPTVKLATLIALNTGLRRSNVLNLTWSAVKLSKRLIELPGQTMKSGKPHTVDIPEHLVHILKTWRDSHILTRFVFPDATGQAPIANFRTSWDKTIDTCGFTDVSFHGLRHTYASQFLMAGGDLSTLSEILDHSSIQITKDIYGHLSRSHMRKASDDFASNFLVQFK